MQPPVKPCILDMVRPLRLEFSGALYHVTARGNQRRAIFLGHLFQGRYKGILVEKEVARPLSEFAARYAERDRAMAAAYRTGAHSMQAIADYFGVGRMTVSRAVKREERGDCPPVTSDA